jgi:hypothetical protein
MFSKIINIFSRSKNSQPTPHQNPHQHPHQNPHQNPHLNQQNKINQNKSQLLGIITSTIPEFISITISNLAFWFIPQTIDTSISSTTHSSTLSASYLSSLSSLPWPDLVLISINLLTALAFIILYIIEIRREIWLVRHFDYSRRYHSLRLTQYKQDYPDIFTTLGSYNRHYYMIYRIMRIILLANIIASASIIITLNVLATGAVNYKTITGMITSFWLAYSKVSRGLCIAHESLQGNLGIAYFNAQNLSFNRIDPKFKRHTSNSNMGIGTGTAQASRIASRRGSLQPSSCSNSISPPDSLNNSLSSSFPMSFKTQVGNENEIHVQGLPVIYIEEMDFIEEKNI